MVAPGVVHCRKCWYVVQNGHACQRCEGTKMDATFVQGLGETKAKGCIALGCFVLTTTFLAGAVAGAFVLSMWIG